jgi:hypothetical protein
MNHWNCLPLADVSAENSAVLTAVKRKTVDSYERKMGRMMFRRFIEECCLLGDKKNFRVSSANLWVEFCRWARDEPPGDDDNIIFAVAAAAAAENEDSENRPFAANYGRNNTSSSQDGAQPPEVDDQKRPFPQRFKIDVEKQLVPNDSLGIATVFQGTIMRSSFLDYFNEKFGNQTRAPVIDGKRVYGWTGIIIKRHFHAKRQQNLQNMRSKIRRQQHQNSRESPPTRQPPQSTIKASKKRPRLDSQAQANRGAGQNTAIATAAPNRTAAEAATEQRFRLQTAQENIMILSLMHAAPIPYARGSLKIRRLAQWLPNVRHFSEIYRRYKNLLEQTDPDQLTVAWQQWEIDLLVLTVMRWVQSLRSDLSVVERQALISGVANAQLQRAQAPPPLPPPPMLPPLSSVISGELATMNEFEMAAVAADQEPMLTESNPGNQNTAETNQTATTKWWDLLEQLPFTALAAPNQQSGAADSAALAQLENTAVQMEALVREVCVSCEYWDWEAIARAFPHRSVDQVKRKWIQLLKQTWGRRRTELHLPEEGSGEWSAADQDIRTGGSGNLNRYDYDYNAATSSLLPYAGRGNYATFNYAADEYQASEGDGRVYDDDDDDDEELYDDDDYEVSEELKQLLNSDDDDDFPGGEDEHRRDENNAAGNVGFSICGRRDILHPVDRSCFLPKSDDEQK